MRIWRIKPPTAVDEAEDEGDEGDNEWTACVTACIRVSVKVRLTVICRMIVGDFDDHKCVLTNAHSRNTLTMFVPHRSAVSRVEWNITGTILSSAGNDGRVRLWKATAGNVWRPAGHISVEQAEDQQDVDMHDDHSAD